MIVSTLALTLFTLTRILENKVNKVEVLWVFCPATKV